jgi:hypothetical protein
VNRAKSIIRLERVIETLDDAREALLSPSEATDMALPYWLEDAMKELKEEVNELRGAP